jgi:orotidine-5'-phosphate decarboxylase
MQKKIQKKIIIALDFSEKPRALDLVSKLDPENCRVKVGKEMFTRFGPQFVEQLQLLGFEVFLDLKFHDIPNTVAKAVQAAADLGVWMVNVHASGGLEMMQAAQKALVKYGEQRPLLIAVTVLTSMSEEDLKFINVNTTVQQQVVSLAKLTQQAELDGVVCSAQETGILRQQLPADFKLITPGIRPQGSNKDDQKRVVTPSEALQMGSDYLVIGRPITQSKDPLKMLEKINKSLC